MGRLPPRGSCSRSSLLFSFASLRQPQLPLSAYLHWHTITAATDSTTPASAEKVHLPSVICVSPAAFSVFVPPSVSPCSTHRRCADSPSSLVASAPRLALEHTAPAALFAFSSHFSPPDCLRSLFPLGLPAPHGKQGAGDKAATGEVRLRCQCAGARELLSPKAKAKCTEHPKGRLALRQAHWLVVHGERSCVRCDADLSRAPLRQVRGREHVAGTGVQVDLAEAQREGLRAVHDTAQEYVDGMARPEALQHQRRRERRRDPEVPMRWLLPLPLLLLRSFPLRMLSVGTHADGRRKA
ncbi:hypothetical protein LSCM4_04586 [Leishmania orientalis]|uniref:Uncharacterized protein n=1 Tax=Leishmania orientalis TaxID=2249476 RepID=A0A836KLF6_9TRYP|nr:hypothetical protein LSCM4_04586 [Leishmania orientalis]